jgi:signal transduction histidine kinase/CheY-like chemotaxis protein
MISPLISSHPTGVRILAIDDDPTILTLIEIITQKMGFQLIQAKNGLETGKVLELAAANNDPPFDLVLLDLMLPETRGEDLLEWLRLQPLTATSPIIILSALNQIDKRVEMMGKGADDYLVKPFHVNEFMTRIEIYVKLGRLQREKRESERQLAQRTNHLAAINEIGHTAVQYLDLDQMLDYVVNAIPQRFNFASCTIFLRDREAGIFNQYVTSDKNWSPSQGTPFIVQQAIATGQIQQQRSVVALPIERDDLVLGVMMVIETADNKVSSPTVDALSVLCNQLTTAILNSYLFYSLQEHNQQLQLVVKENNRLLSLEKVQRQQGEELHLTTKLVTSSLDLTEVLAAATDRIREMLHVEMGSILLLDEPNNQLTFASTLNDVLPLQTIRLQADKGIVGQVVQNGHPLIVNNIHEYPDFSPIIDKLTGKQTHTILCVPLIAKDKVIGAIELINKKDGLFNEVDLSLLSSIASTIAVAIDNARLYREQANLIQQLHNSQKQLLNREKLAATGRMAASLAHEINNPLQAIHSCLQLAIHFDLGKEKQHDYLQMAAEEVERVIGMSTRILEFARPSTGTFQITNVNKLIGQVMRLADKHISHRKTEIQQFLASDLPSVYVVPDQIAQIFLGIILNALDAMSDTGLLTITTRRQDEWIETVFTDNGMGMSPETLSHIFEPFFSTKEGMAGLGLTVAYNIVERHGGKIVVTSELGQGTTVTVSLPIRQETT